MSRYVCLIDSLNSGGAQRQMVYLASGLADRGAEVHLVTYHDLDHFGEVLAATNVDRHFVEGRNRLLRCFEVRRLIRSLQPDAIIAFLDVPNVMGILSSFGWPRVPVLVSERNTSEQPIQISERIRFLLYRFADVIVCNTETQRQLLNKLLVPRLRELRTICNCVDIEVFRPRAISCQHGGIKLIVPASLIPRKNPSRLIDVTAKLRDEGIDLSVDWVGIPQQVDDSWQHSGFLAQIRTELRLASIETHFRLLPKTTSIHLKYREYDAMLLPSLREGTPNAVCEAMSCGLPVLVSDVGDNSRHVDAPHGGFVFDPTNTSEIEDAIRAFAKLTRASRSSMGVRNRDYALANFSRERLVSQFEELLHGMTDVSCEED